MSDLNDTYETPIPEEYLAQVKWYNPKKHYGFATILSTQKDVFIHKNSIIGNSQDEERFWNKCLFENELISMTLAEVKGRMVGENIRSSETDNDGKPKPLLFASPNMKAYVGRFKERWENSHNTEWKTVSNK